MAQATGEAGDRDGRGVGRDHCIACRSCLDPPQHPDLGVPLFKHGLDHEVAPSNCLLHGRGAPDERPHGLGSSLGNEVVALVATHVPQQEVQRGRGAFLRDVGEDAALARLRQHLGDAPAHVASPNDRDLLRPSHRTRNLPRSASYPGRRATPARARRAITARYGTLKCGPPRSERLGPTSAVGSDRPLGHDGWHYRDRYRYRYQYRYQSQSDDMCDRQEVVWPISSSVTHDLDSTREAPAS